MIRTLLGMALGALMIAALVFGWVFVREAYLSAPIGERQTIQIDETDLETVSRQLESNGLIPSAFRFRLFEQYSGENKIKAGEYQLRPGTSYRDIARTLGIGPARREVQVTIIEGLTVDEVAAELEKEQGIDLRTTASLVGRSVDKQSFAESLRDDFPFLKNLPGSRSLDGYLFPDTYRVWADQLPDGLVNKQLQEFSDRFAKALPGPNSAPLKTLDDVVILASILQGEVTNPDDMKIVAGIFLNRLRIGMRLQTDATLNYLTGSGRARSHAEDLQIDSPYNTYKYAGLPPSPIGNPGADAIEAVLDPTPSNYFYFLTDKNGKVYYAKTLEEHAANRAKAGF